MKANLSIYLSLPVKTETPVLPPREVKVNQKARKADAILPGLEGWKLNGNIKTLQQGACLVGAVFETVTGARLGLDRNTTSSYYELCPDLSDLRKGILFESKSCGHSGRLLVLHDQLNDYLEAYANGYNCFYTLWLYESIKPCAQPKKKPIHAVIESVAMSISTLFLLDVRILDAMRKATGWTMVTGVFKPYSRTHVPGLSYRHCACRYRAGRTIDRYYLQVSRVFFEALSTKPRETLTALGLDPMQYVWKRSRARTTFLYNGVEFTTNPYAVFTVRHATEVQITKRIKLQQVQQRASPQVTVEAEPIPF